MEINKNPLDEAVDNFLTALEKFTAAAARESDRERQAINLIKQGMAKLCSDVHELRR